MPRPRAPVLTQFSQRLSIETPEHVSVEFELAGLGSRVAALLVDYLLLGVVYWLLGSILGALAGDTGIGAWVTSIGIVIGFLVTWGYFLLFEALNHGRTPGKMALGIRVVLETGHPLTFSASAARNLVRLVDSAVLPFLGPLFVLLHPHNKRLGDMVAGTIVVRDRPSDVTLAHGVSAPEGQPEPIDAGPPRLDDAEYRLLGQVLERLDTLEPARSRALLTTLAARVAAKIPQLDPDSVVFLSAVFDDERRRRRGRFAARAGGGPGRTVVTAERFIARKQAAWERFHQDATEVEREGLKSLGADALLAFAARYREVAADLARARTYDVDARVQEYLERVVATGHNAVYGLQGFQRRRL